MATKAKAKAQVKAGARSKAKRTKQNSARRKTAKKPARKAEKKSAKKTAKKVTKSSAKKTAKQETSEEALRQAAITAAFARAAEHGWEAVRLDEVAMAVGVSPLRLRSLYGRADDILFDFMAHTDAALAAEPPEGSVRDRLLELLIRRLDAYEPHREGICRIWQDLQRDPRLGLRLAPKSYGSFAATLRLAGAKDDTAHVFGFAAVHMAVLNVWCADDDASRNRTLAAADKYLGWAERLASFCD